LLNAADGESAGRLDGAPSGFGITRFFANGTRVMGATREKTFLWTLGGDGKPAVIENHITDNANAQAAAISADGSRIAFANNQQVAVRESQSGETIGTFNTPQPNIAVVLSPDGSLVAAAGGIRAYDPETEWVPAGNFAVYLWHVEGTVGKDVFARHDSVVNCMAMDPAGKNIVTSSKDGKIRVWDIATGKVDHDFAADAFTGIAVSPDGKRLAGLAGTSMKVMDLSTGQVSDTFTARKEFKQIPVFSPDGKHLLAASLDRKLTYFTLGDKKPTATMTITEIPAAMSIAPDGAKAYAITGYNNYSKLLAFELATGTPVEDVPVPDIGRKAPAPLMGLSPDGKKLIFAGEGNNHHLIALAYDFKTATQTDVGPGCAMPTTRLVSLDGKWITWRNEKDEFYLANLSADVSRGPYKMPQKPTCAQVITPDGSCIYMGCEDGTIRFLKR